MLLAKKILHHPQLPKTASCGSCLYLFLRKPTRESSQLVLSDTVNPHTMAVSKYEEGSREFRVIMIPPLNRYLSGVECAYEGRMERERECVAGC